MCAVNDMLRKSEGCWVRLFVYSRI